MKIGFIRQSVNLPSLEIQKEALLKEGCEKIFVEKVKSIKERKQLAKLKEYIKKDDVVIAWKLSAFDITTLELIKLINYFNDKEVHFKSLNDSLIDTTVPHGEEIFRICEGLADFQREIIRKKAKVSLASARTRAKGGGRPKGLSEIAKMKAKVAAIRYKKGDRLDAIMEDLEIGSKATLYRYLRYEGLEFNYNKKAVNSFE